MLYIYCRPNDDHFIRVETWQGEDLSDEVTELLEELEADDAPNVSRVRSHLAHVVESIALELKVSDLDGMGLPLAFYAAMWLAERGDGLVEYEGDWFDPRVSYFERRARADEQKCERGLRICSPGRSRDFEEGYPSAP